MKNQAKRTARTQNDPNTEKRRIEFERIGVSFRARKRRTTTAYSQKNIPAPSVAAIGGVDRAIINWNSHSEKRVGE